MLSIQFLSKECKNNSHLCCDQKWVGLGLEVHCYCKCHFEKDIGLDKILGANKVRVLEKKSLQPSKVPNQDKTVAILNVGEKLQSSILILILNAFQMETFFLH